MVAQHLAEMLFQSTPPARGATAAGGKNLSHRNISIHAPREGGDVFRPVLGVVIEISIHAPREGGDRLRRYR